MKSGNAGETFNSYYFAHACGRPYQRDAEWLAFFDGIAERISVELRPRTVLDAGCAMGFLVEGLRKRGIEAYGLDISDYAIHQVDAHIRDYCRVGSLADPLPRDYDLIVCMEVLEHMPPDEGRRAIQNLCAHTGDILFSSTPFDYREATHFNVQPPEYWAELFARQEFIRDVDFDASFITTWAVRFRRTNETVARIVRDYERRYSTLWKENCDLRSLVAEMRGQLAEAERMTRNVPGSVSPAATDESERHS